MPFYCTSGSEAAYVVVLLLRASFGPKAAYQLTGFLGYFFQWKFRDTLQLGFSAFSGSGPHSVPEIISWETAPHAVDSRSCIRSTGSRTRHSRPPGPSSAGIGLFGPPRASFAYANVGQSWASTSRRLASRALLKGLRERRVC